MLTKTPSTIIAAATSNAVSGTTRGTADMRSSYGGMLTIKITNGATGPTVQAVANILMSHSDGATPEAASAGADWKTIFSVGNGVTANTVGEWSMPIDPSINHIEVEITGNTGQAVTCEAFVTKIPSLS